MQKRWKISTKSIKTILVMKNFMFLPIVTNDETTHGMMKIIFQSRICLISKYIVPLREWLFIIKSTMLVDKDITIVNVQRFALILAL